MNIEDAMGIMHPNTTYMNLEVFNKMAKDAITKLETRSSAMGYDIECSEVIAEKEHLHFTAASGEHYAEFSLWYDEGQIKIDYVNLNHTVLDDQAMQMILECWAPLEPQEPEMSPYHADNERFEK